MYIVFDIGGTKTRIAALERLSDPIPDNPAVIPTEQSFPRGIAAMEAAVSKISSGRAMESGVCAIAGPLDPNRERPVNAPNLPDWAGKPLRRELSRIINAPVMLENDAALAGLGEAHHGAGRGYGIVAYINVGTGVGGARVVGGRIDERRFGFEPGHQIVSLFDCGAKGRGTLEALVSGAYLKERMGRAPKDIPQDDVVWEELSFSLSVGVHNTIVHWSPDVVVLGGSMITGDPCIPLSSVSRHLASLLTIFPKVPTIMRAECGDFGGLWGGAVLLRQEQGKEAAA